jgi:SLT domain-containing protein/phage-related protein
VKKYGAAGLALAGVGTTFAGLKLFEELPLVGPLLESIVKPFEKVTEKVAEFGKQAGRGLLPKALAGGAEAEGGEAAAAAISAPIAAALAAFALLMAASPKFRAAVIGLGKDLITALKPAFLAIWNGIKLVIPFVMQFAKMLGDDLAPIVTRIAVLLIPLGKILGLVIGTWFKLLAVELKFLMPILGWALGLLGKVLLWLSTPLLWLANGLKLLLPYVAIAAAAISRFADAAGTKVIPIFRAIGAVLKAVWGGIVETIRIAVAVVKAIIYIGFILIRAYILVVWLVIRTATRLLWGWFGPYIKAIWNAILIVARVVWRAIAGAITSVWHAVTTALKVAFNWIKSAMSAAWNWARSTTVRLWHAVVAPLIAFWSVVKGPISKALSWIKDVLGAAWRWLSSVTATLWDAITAPLRAFWAVIKKPITDALNWIKKTFSDAWTGLVNAVSGVAGNIIDGLKSGFGTALKDIGKWLKANVVDPIIDHIKGFFGIKSPSTVMAGIGINLIKGLFTGMIPGIKDLGGMVLKLFGSWPAALGHAVEKGLLGLAALPGKALSALGKVGGWFAGLFGGGGGTVKAGAGVQQWAGVVAQVLAMLGHPELQSLILAQMQTESGGRVDAINLSDSNALAGHPSQGLMQVIPSTFAAYAGPFRSRGILDPLANIYAGAAYALARYGKNIWNVLGHGHGYAQGGIIREPVWGMGLRSGQPYSLGEAGPEAVLSAEQLRKLYALLAHPLGRIVLGQLLPASLMPAGQHPAARIDAHALHLAHVAHLAHLYALAHPAPVRTYRAPGADFGGDYSARAATGSSSAERAEQQRYTNLFRAHAEQTVINVYPRESQSETEIAANVSAKLAWAAQGGMR